MTVLVTGAPGWLGSRLVERLTACGRKVRCLVEPRRDASALRALGAEVYIGDVRDAKAVAATVRGVETVIHAAGVIHPPRTADFFDINVGGTVQLLEASLRAEIRRFVHVSSEAAAGFNKYRHLPMTEEDQPRPISSYGRSKLLAEQAVDRYHRRFGLPTVNIRPAMFYGPGQPDRRMRLLRLVQRGRAILFGDGQNLRSMTYIDNLVDALIQAETAPSAVGQTYWVLVLLAASVTASLTPVYPRFGLFHFGAALPLLAVVTGAAVQYPLPLISKLRRRGIPSPAAVVTLPAFQRAFLAALLVLLSLPSISQPYLNRLGRERRIAEYAHLAPLAQWVRERTEPGDRIFVFPDSEETANLYVLTERQPPNYWSFAYSWYTAVPAVRERLLRSVRQEPPRWVVYAPDMVAAGVLLRETAPEISDYLAQHYRSVTSFVVPGVGRVWLMALGASSGAEVVPLFRLWHAAFDDYLYTTDAVERDIAERNGYVDRGICCQLFVQQVGATTALFRLRHAPSGRHFYTTSVAERDAAIQQLGFVSEGVAGYCYPPGEPQPPGSQPLWRLLKPGVHHFYTTSATERDQYVGNGYRLEGIACYVPVR